MFSTGREYVESTMTCSFHRFAGVAPSSWQTYARLASLAKEKYGLQVAAPSLPERNISQGVACALANISPVDPRSRTSSSEYWVYQKEVPEGNLMLTAVN